MGNDAEGESSFVPRADGADPVVLQKSILVTLACGYEAGRRTTTCARRKFLGRKAAGGVSYGAAIRVPAR